MGLGHGGYELESCWLFAVRDASVRGVGHGMKLTGEPIGKNLSW